MGLDFQSHAFLSSSLPPVFSGMNTCASPPQTYEISKGFDERKILKKTLPVHRSQRLRGSLISVLPTCPRAPGKFESTTISYRMPSASSEFLPKMCSWRIGGSVTTARRPMHHDHIPGHNRYCAMHHDHILGRNSEEAEGTLYDIVVLSNFPGALGQAGRTEMRLS
jgi:hypothetical protein